MIHNASTPYIKILESQKKIIFLKFKRLLKNCILDIIGGNVYKLLL